jgi:hypothetical protein
MKKLFTNFSNFALENGSRMTRDWLDISSAIARRFFPILALLLFLGVENAWGTEYELVTSTSGLVAGAHYVIGNGSSGSVKFMSTANIANYRGETSAQTVTNNKVTATNDMLVLTLGGSTNAWTLYTYNYAGTAGYLASAASGSNNYCRVLASSTTGTITFSSNQAIINLNPHTSRTKLQYNSQNTRFACYSSNQAAIYLYKEVTGGGSTPTITTSSSMTTLTYSNGSPVAQSFTVGGTNLTADVRVTAPTDYEVSTNNSTFSDYVDLSYGSGTLSNTTVYIRLKSGLSGGNIASRNISLTSTGATTQTIAVTGSVPYTITWMANGNLHATTYVTVGSTLALPATDPVPNSCGCTGKAFYGWYGGGTSYKNASVAPSIAAAGDAVNADKTYYAVFADADDGSQTSTLTASAQGWSDGANATTKTISTVTYTWAQNSGSNAPKYYNSGTAVRLYNQTSGTNGNQVTISSSNTITGIVFTYVTDYAFLTNAPSVGTLTAAGVWSGSATSITFKNKNNAQVRIQSIVVTYGGISYSNYDTSCASCDANPTIGAASLNGSIS